MRPNFGLLFLFLVLSTPPLLAQKEESGKSAGCPACVRRSLKDFVVIASTNSGDLKGIGPPNSQDPPPTEGPSPSLLLAERFGYVCTVHECNGQNFLCHGVLISKKILITLPHCIKEKALDALVVQCGSREHDYSTRTCVEEVRYEDSREDVVVLILSDPLDVETPIIKNLEKESFSPGYNYRVVYWDNPDFDAAQNSSIKYYTVESERDENCQRQELYVSDESFDDILCTSKRPGATCEKNIGKPPPGGNAKPLVQFSERDLLEQSGKLDLVCGLESPRSDPCEFDQYEEFVSLIGRGNWIASLIEEVEGDVDYEASGSVEALFTQRNCMFACSTVAMDSIEPPAPELDIGCEDDDVDECFLMDQPLDGDFYDTAPGSDVAFSEPPYYDQDTHSDSSSPSPEIIPTFEELIELEPPESEESPMSSSDRDLSCAEIVNESFINSTVQNDNLEDLHRYMDCGGLLRGRQLLVAARYNSYQCAALLVDYVDVDYADDGNKQTAAHIAAQNNSIDVAEILLENEANVNATDQSGSTPLHLCVAGDFQEMTKLFLRYRSDINAQDQGGWAPIHLAAYYDHDDLIKIYGEEGAYIDIQTISSQTSLYIASNRGNYISVETLLSFCADCEDGDASRHRPIDVICENADNCTESQKKEIFDLLEKLPIRRRKRYRLLLKTGIAAKRMAEIFGVQKLHDYLASASSLAEGPVWLLGACYNIKSLKTDDSSAEEAQKEFKRHFWSLLWITYRYNFSSEGMRDWTSDFGWGCAIRSTQMMIAQALMEHLKAPEFRNRENGNIHCADMSAVVKLFYDNPAQDHVFSIHSICKKAENYGSGPGYWMGPGFVCRLVDEVNNAVRPFNLHSALIAHPDGAPFLTPTRINGLRQIFDKKEVGSEDKAESVRSPGLLLFIPLVLGMSKIDDRYLKQLKEVLKWSQSVGFVGGRENSSLYFVGIQEDNMLYLDPHQARRVAGSPTDVVSYLRSPIKLMPISSLITSISIGFYCKTREEFDDLMDKLQKQENLSEGAPLLSFIDAEPKLIPKWSVGEPGVETFSDGAQSVDSDGWELVETMDQAL